MAIRPSRSRLRSRQGVRGRRRRWRRPQSHGRERRTPDSAVAGGRAGSVGVPARPARARRRLSHRGRAAAVKANLERVPRDLPKLLQSEFVEETALSTLELLVEQRAKIPLWPVSSVRDRRKCSSSSAESQVRQSKSCSKRCRRTSLPACSRNITNIVKNSDVRPGSNLLVSEEMTPKNSAKDRGIPPACTPDAARKDESQGHPGLVALDKGRSRTTSREAGERAFLSTSASRDLKRTVPSACRAKSPRLPTWGEDPRKTRSAAAPRPRPVRWGTSPQTWPSRSRRWAKPKAANSQTMPNATRSRIRSRTTGRRSAACRRARTSPPMPPATGGKSREREHVMESGTEVFASGNKTRFKIDPALFKTAARLHRDECAGNREGPIRFRRTERGRHRSA